eukprot:2737513-Pyramimonas_sp.AAC.1
MSACLPAHAPVLLPDPSSLSPAFRCSQLHEVGSFAKVLCLTPLDNHPKAAVIPSALPKTHCQSVCFRRRLVLAALGC